jgi:hypothetical protein
VPVASWLLKRFAGVEAVIIGDIDEQFARRRSSCWYWRQAVGDSFGIAEIFAFPFARDPLSRPHVGVVIAWVGPWTLYLW